MTSQHSADPCRVAPYTTRSQPAAPRVLYALESSCINKGNVLTKLLALMNDLLFSGELPSTWQRTVVQMLPKTAKTMVTSDYRPIASVRVLYKLFAYLVLSRIEHILDSAQPEEQHGCRKIDVLKTI